MRGFGRGIALLGLAVAASGASVSAQDAQGWHVVRPGDTLEGTTARYLGSARDWRENWKLNPGVRDPDLLLPGQRLRVLLRPALSQPAAQVRNVRRSVDEMPAPIPWKPAENEDILIARDGLRTAKDASAELRFTDGTSLKVDADSLVFVGASESASNRQPSDIEIVRGQSEVEVVPAARQEGEVEIVVGPARARGRSTEGTSGRLRVRRPEVGAQVMVYAGAGDLAAGGARVDLPAGTGSVVPEQGKPSAPEALLAAPTPESPAEGAVLRVANPKFVWTPTPGADSYFIELCADRDCRDLLYRGSTAAASWAADSIPPGSYFWRVSSRSATGLDGFASSARAFAVTGAVRDGAAPTASLALQGQVVARAGTRYVPARVPLQVGTADDSGGVARWDLVVNDEVLSQAQRDAAWTGGAYRAFIRVWDEAGNQTTSPVVEFTVDDLPPEITFAAAAAAELRDYGAPMPLAGATLRRASVAARREHARLSLSGDGGSWLPIPETPGPVWRAQSQEPQVFLLAVEGDPFSTGAPQLAGGDLLRVRASDAGAGVESLEVRVASGEGGSSVLQAIASDRVGNEVTISWPLRPR